MISLRVAGATCANGKKVVRAYHACRKRNGGRDGRARCKKSCREVFHKYTQNT